MKNPGWSCFDFTLHDYTNTPEMLDHVKNDRRFRVPFARRADPHKHRNRPAQPETYRTASVQKRAKRREAHSRG